MFLRASDVTGERIVSEGQHYTQDIIIHEKTTDQAQGGSNDCKTVETIA